MKEPVHGKQSTYTHHGCHCTPCRAANTAEQRKRKADRRARLAADPTIVEHGRLSTYTNWGCLCPPCRAAGSADNRRAWLRRAQDKAVDDAVDRIPRLLRTPRNDPPGVDPFRVTG